jgi:xylan 1,4-beta-xylosidase
MPLPRARLEVDFSVASGVIRPLHGVNLGPLMMNGWLDVSAIYKELAFPLTRLHDCPYAVPETVDVHSIFPIFDADPQDPQNYRFAMTDDYIQAILDTGSQIVYRLGETIEHYTRRRYHVHPPADFAKWAAICVNIIRHYNQGWADGFHHNIRYWEIWNEPMVQPQCWTGTMAQYYQLYEVTAKAIKAFDQTLMVGGPTECRGEPEWAFLEHCRRSDAPLDFYSWHVYARDPIEIVELARQHRDALNSAGYAQAESHLNEWNLLPTEGWQFNSPEKNPDCIRRACEEIGGITGASFDAATLIYMQDLPVDSANFYWVRDSFWGILDQYGAKRKNYYAFKAFRAMLDTNQRVKTTPNDAATGYALLAGLGEDAWAGVLLANYRAREANFNLTCKGWPWKGSAVCRCYLLDYDRNLTLIGEHRLDEGNATLDLCMPAPAFCYMTVTPA